MDFIFQLNESLLLMEEEVPSLGKAKKRVGPRKEKPESGDFAESGETDNYKWDLDVESKEIFPKNKEGESMKITHLNVWIRMWAKQKGKYTPSEKDTGDIVEKWSVGDKVVHPAKPEWGVGIVKSVAGNRVTIDFEDKTDTVEDEDGKSKSVKSGLTTINVSYVDLDSAEGSNEPDVVFKITKLGASRRDKYGMPKETYYYDSRDGFRKQHRLDDLPKELARMVGESEAAKIYNSATSTVRVMR